MSASLREKMFLLVSEVLYSFIYHLITTTSLQWYF